MYSVSLNYDIVQIKRVCVSIGRNRRVNFQTLDIRVRFRVAKVKKDASRRDVQRDKRRVQNCTAQLLSARNVRSQFSAEHNVTRAHRA